MVSEHNNKNDIRRKKLNNGLVTILSSNKYCHKFTISIYLKAGILFEEPEQYGISHLVKHIMYRDWNGLAQDDLYRLTEEIGGTLKGATNKGYINFEMTVSPRFYKEATQLFTRAFHDYLWSSKVISQEKNVVLKRLEFADDSYEQYINRKYAKSASLLSSVMGTPSSIKRLSKRKINEWKRKIFNTQNATLIMTGNIDDIHYEFMMNEFSKLVCNGQQLPERTPLIIPDFGVRSKNSLFVDNMSDERSYICAMFDLDISNIEWQSFIYLYNLLCLGDKSRLGYLLKDVMCITDMIDSNYEIFGKQGYLMIEFSINNQDLCNALDSMFDVFRSMKNSITENDMKLARIFLTDNQYWKLDDSEELNKYQGWSMFYMNERLESVGNMDAIVDKYNSVTANDVMQIANSLFKPENLTLIVSNNNRILRTKELNKHLLKLSDSLRINDVNISSVIK